VIVLHGGPADAGGADPIARELSDEFRTYAPWQRRSSDQALTVARHIADLRELIRERFNDIRPAIIGESWGAMLALAYAATHPDTVGPIVLVGCGTFDKTSRTRLKEVIEARTTDEMRECFDHLENEISDPNERMIRRNKLLRRIYDYDSISPPGDGCPKEPFDRKAHIETWNDMIRCQETGLYPKSFTAISTPIIMLYGAYDPHPGQMIRDVLMPYIPSLAYREWKKCGHRPWVERHSRDEFYFAMREWLKHNFRKMECHDSLKRPK